MSSIELICLELSVLLFIAHVVCQTILAHGEFGQPFPFSPRDKSAPRSCAPRAGPCGSSVRP
jgi:hypothetical protein